MSAEVLRPACELAFAVAREGMEAAEPIDPPVSMRSFLYVDDLPRRAIAAAQQVIEENSDFRHRVASRADEDEVGRAGYLWLHRPTGWAVEFEALANELDDDHDLDPFADHDPELEAVYKGLTTEPVELIRAQPPEPEPDVGFELDPLPTALVDDLGQPDDLIDVTDLGDVGEIDEISHVSDRIDDLDDDHPATRTDDHPATGTDDDRPAFGDDRVDAGDDGFDLDLDRHSDESSNGRPPVFDAPMATVTPIAGLGEPLTIDHPTSSSATLGLAAVTNTEQADVDPVDATGFQTTASDASLDATDGGFEAADALESELDSLRGLVARLANERDTDEPPPPPRPIVAATTTGDVEPEHEVTALAAPPAITGDADGLRSDLESAKHELYLAQADLTIARQEREEAQRLQSEALKHQVQLEKELTTVREEKAALESDLGSAQARAISIEERFGRLETQIADGDRERDNVQAQLDTMTLERNQIRDERAGLKAERDELRASLDDIAEKTDGADLVELVQSHKTTSAELENTSRELARIIGQAENYEEQLSSLTTEMAAIKSERIELRARLGEAETALDVTTTQYDALKIDAERTAAELGALRAERDGLQSQLAELQASLAEMLDERAEGRQRNDVDRKALNELRVEYDVVAARLADLELNEQAARSKAENLIIERDNLLAGRDELLEERGQLRAELATAVGERGSADEQLLGAQERLRNQETELQMERRQREELANRLLELDDLAERTAAEQRALNEERERLADTVAQLETELEAAAAVARERDDLAAELTAVRRNLDQTGEEIDHLTIARSEAENQLASTQDQLTELQAKVAETEILRRERDDLAEEIAATRTTNDEAMKALRYDLDEANREVQRHDVARADVERQLSTLQARTAEIEQQRDQLQAAETSASGANEEMRSALQGRDQELDDLRASLTSARREADEATAALQAKEGELQTALDARKSEIAELRAQLDDLGAGASTPVLGAMASAAPGTDELASTRSELEEANAELGQLRNELAAARVELASTTAELEARGEIPSSDIGAPPVDPLLDGGRSEGESDELDSMAAEVRNALRGPSMLDTIAGPNQAPALDGGLDDPAVAAEATGEGSTPTVEISAETDAVTEVAEVADGLTDDAAPAAAAVGAASMAAVAGATDEAEDAVRGLDAPNIVDEDATAPMPTPATAEAPGDNELDAVSELISMKVNSFQQGDLPNVGPPSDENLDLAAELARTPTELSSADVDEALATDVGPPSLLGDGPDVLRPAEQADLAVHRPGGSKRRRIDVPGDIIDDEVAVARYVVSSPDVVLLVDGDSVAQLGWPSLPVAQQRDALVTYLADLSTSSGAAPDVVFDGRLGDDDSLPASRAVRIRLSTPPTPPTAALDELVDAYPEQWPIALVTDNTELAATAADRGAAVLNNGQLLDLFIAE